MVDDDKEGTRGIGRVERRRMKKRWKKEGAKMSLKEWAKTKGEVGDAALVWMEHKRSGRS